MRTNVVLPVVLALVALIAAGVPTVALWALRDAAADPDEVMRLGLLVSAAIGMSLAAFFLGWALLAAWIGRPIAALAREARALAEKPVDRILALPRHHALGPLPPAVLDLAKRVLAAQAATGDQIRNATQRADEQRSRLEAILVDLTEGVIVCNLDNRILLYNQAAARILGNRESLGLGRSILALLTSDPLLHALEQLSDRAAAAGDDVADAPQQLVCATLDLAVLLEARASLVRDPAGRISGYVLTFADASARIDSLGRRDAMLREITGDWRRPLASLKVAAATLRDDCDLTPAEQHAFIGVIAQEVERLDERFAALCRDYDALPSGGWPMSAINSLDLFRAVGRHVADRDGITVTQIGVPTWLRADSHALMIALEVLARQVARQVPSAELDIEARPGDGRTYVELSWQGAPIPSGTLASWLDAPLAGTVGSRSLREIVELHHSELWSAATDGGRAVLRLPLHPPETPVRDVTARPAPRPEFYDFDLFETAHAELASTPLRRMSFVVFDTETTGLKPSEGDELLSIGAVRIVNGRILTGETFERLINPGRDIPAASTRIHGITPEMVRDKPPAKIVLPQFREFAGDAVLVAYNAAFDMKFLEMKEREAGVQFDNPVLDALLLAISTFKDAPDHSLQAMAHRLGVEIAGRHTALGDAMMTAAVWVGLVEQLEARGIDTFGKAVEISTRMMHERRLVAQF